LRFGILGGTFDPIHFGHLRLAEEVGEELGLERVYLIPAASPPHKDDKPISAFQHRMAMTRMAVKGSPLLEALDLEAHRQGRSYSIETLKEFRRLFKGDFELFFIIGMDAFLEIGTWKDYKALFDHAHFLAISRPGFQSVDIGAFLTSLHVGFKKEGDGNTFVGPSGNRLIFKEATLMDISSTDIRNRVMARKTVRFLVPEAVREYIIEKGLYMIHGNSR
jgi:nicotinate-nucleotide adenylyltransferase